METVREMLGWARRALADVPQSEPLDAYVLLEALLGVERAALLAHPERLLTATQAARYREMVERRAQGVPVAYLSGRRIGIRRRVAGVCRA